MSSALLLDRLHKYLHVLALQYPVAFFAFYKGQKTNYSFIGLRNREKKTEIVLCFFYFCISTCLTGEMILMLLSVMY